MRNHSGNNNWNGNVEEIIEVFLAVIHPYIYVGDENERMWWFCFGWVVPTILVHMTYTFGNAFVMSMPAAFLPWLVLLILAIANPIFCYVKFFTCWWMDRCKGYLWSATDAPSDFAAGAISFGIQLMVLPWFIFPLFSNHFNRAFAWDRVSLLFPTLMAGVGLMIICIIMCLFEKWCMKKSKENRISHH
ncbi:MAG: hypothetical protein ACOCXQ_01560 [Patescibacteria group bacterium]